ncbi:hypothetical protein I553_6818 [Mycobacterium xenopi 4042]|uniref:Uncharacterized protein n=1 Tax=Mycobacterium xenopi 4042 TaxID=1299334 RepID=X7Z2W8_MYCXE|nr:hypothetical protein I553_6818 [Mycobacterium xenopi 4042]
MGNHGQGCRRPAAHRSAPLLRYYPAARDAAPPWGFRANSG